MLCQMVLRWAIATGLQTGRAWQATGYDSLATVTGLPMATAFDSILASGRRLETGSGSAGASSPDLGPASPARRGEPRSARRRRGVVATWPHLAPLAAAMGSSHAQSGDGSAGWRIQWQQRMVIVVIEDLVTVKLAGSAAATDAAVVEMEVVGLRRTPCYAVW